MFRSRFNFFFIGQITSRYSFRDLISIIDAHENKSYHLGFGKGVSRSNFAMLFF
ncbi:DUF4372 domain-containing protein [Emticicia fontis]